MIFDRSVLTPDPVRRGRILEWLCAGLDAVDPFACTAEALRPRAEDVALVVAAGKAAAEMARGADSVLRVAGGLCVSDHHQPVPGSLVNMVGDHPVPGPASFAAGRAALSLVGSADPALDLVALVSGGASALVEDPRSGVPSDYLAAVTRRLLDCGAGIEEMNLIRAHLSQIKGGGLSRAAGRPIDTYVISDVAGANPGTVASGPTINGPHDPERAASMMRRHGIEIPVPVWEAMSTDPGPAPAGKVTVVADGRDAATAIATATGEDTVIRPDWLGGPVAGAVERLLAVAGEGVTIAVGETVLELGSGRGRGGRNTHAALLAASRIAGSGDIFVALATDGRDGSADAAGAIVDGSTIARGGDPIPALRGFDSASYLEASGDLLCSGPTGTNVSDIWLLWRGGRPVA